MSRQIVSYDDITLPYEAPANNRNSNSKPPPTKKRKQNNQRNKGGNSNQAGRKNSTNRGQSFAQSSSYTQAAAQNSSDSWSMDLGEGEYEEEESRELTHEEIWDDSALVDAWEAAQQEYEMYNGKEKDWQKETIKKSPLWYNIPADPLTKQQVNGTLSSQVKELPAPPAAEKLGDDEDNDSRPLNFETFVPTYNPTLPSITSAAPQYVPDTPAGGMVSQDEAFSRAMNAMYWGGYWTAMYHCQRHAAQAASGNDGAEEDEDEDEENAETDAYVSTQR